MVMTRSSMQPMPAQLIMRQLGTDAWREERSAAPRAPVTTARGSGGGGMHC